MPTAFRDISTAELYYEFLKECAETAMETGESCSFVAQQSVTAAVDVGSDGVTFLFFNSLNDTERVSPIDVLLKTPQDLPRSAVEDLRAGAVEALTADIEAEVYGE